MRIFDIFGMSLTNLWRRRVRTILTVLGVVIGTASIVVMLSLGFGLRDAMMEQVGTAGGLTEITVSSDMEYGADELLLGDDTAETFSELEHVEKVDPQLWFNMPVQAGQYENYISLVGVSEEYLEKVGVGEGRLPGEKGDLEILVGSQILTDFFDYSTGEYPFWEDDEKKLDILSMPLIAGIEKESGSSMEEDSVDYLDNYSDPTFSIDEQEFAVEENEYNDFDNANDTVDNSDADNNENIDKNNNMSIDDGMFIGNFDSDEPLSYTNFTDNMKRVQIKACGITEGDSNTYSEYAYNCYTNIDMLKNFLKKNYSVNDVIPGQPTDRQGKPYRDLKYSQFIVKVDQSDNVEMVLEAIQNMGYRAEANKEWLEETEKEFMIIEAVLGGIGAVALLVAAIGIANTMTMSTYERTKEIGIMKVLGCSLGNIRSMFLAEAAFIGLLGGAAGVALSFLLSLLVNKFLSPTIMSEYYGSSANISVIPIWLVLVAIIFATLIGMLAGFFPAQRATKLSPLAAIRNE